MLVSCEAFDGYFRLVHAERQRRPSGRLWCPAADVYCTRDGWIVKVDLAGIRPEDIEINIEGPFLSVSGRRRDNVCGEGISHYHLAITYICLEMTILLPGSV